MDRASPPPARVLPTRGPRRSALVLLLASAPLVLSAPQCARPGVTAVRVAQGLERPVFLTAPPGDERLFVVEEGGRIRIVRDGVLLPRPFLDLTGAVGSGEGRLVGLAFPPDFAQSGEFYVSSLRSTLTLVVERYRVSASDHDVAATSPGQILALTSAQPERIGGRITFGPSGYLWLVVGDDGDPARAQSLRSLYGKVLRMDVRPGMPRVPADNPFAGRFGARGEIWGLGVGAPLGLFVDALSGLLFLEETAAEREMLHTEFVPDGGGLDYAALEPLADWAHGPTGCPELVAGVSYYGSVFEAWGHHFYADACTGRIRSVRPARGLDGAQFVAEERDWTTDLRPDRGSIDAVTGFGLDGTGELHLLDADGEVFRMIPETDGGAIPL